VDAVVVVVVFVVVVVPMPAPHQLKCSEAEAGRDQDGANDRVLCALDARAKLQPDRDDHAAEHY
jgi:hypothetical protein